MREMNLAIEGARDFREFMEQATGQATSGAQYVQPGAGKQPHENREQYRARMKAERRAAKAKA